MRCGDSGLEVFQCDICPTRATDNVCACPARWFFHHFGDKWTLPVLGSLYPGPMRFSQLRKTQEPISERMLILTLKKLEELGFIARGRADSAPNQNSYQLTALGRSLLEHVGELFHWMNTNAPTILATYEAGTAARPALAIEDA